ncbi:MAG: hypothetical protein ABWW70_06995 [Thermoproteota archaeon]
MDVAKTNVNVSIKETRHEASTRTYEVELEVGYRGKVHLVRIGKLLRKPESVQSRVEGDYLVVELYDDKGSAIATCCIHREHLERGCLDCPSLLLPPEKFKGKGC